MLTFLCVYMDVYWKTGSEGPREHLMGTVCLTSML